MQHDTSVRRTSPAAAATTGVCAIIPARGGSKGVPRKNLRVLGDEPLVARAVRSVLAASSVGSVHVSTDDPEIASAARRAGAGVIDRPSQLADDEASSESAVTHALTDLASRGIVPDVTVFVQATSPFIRPGDLDRAVSLVRGDQCDIAFSVVRSDVHLWREGPGGPEGVNHLSAVRLRRQDREPEYAETGAFYVMRTSGFLANGHRFFGRMRFVEVDAGDALEIDTEHDLAVAELLHARRENLPHVEVAAIPARAVVTDFDGVHTDDHVVVDQHGTESVDVSRSDGMGVARLRRAGIPFLILSSETNDVVRARADKLGVDVVAGCDDKLRVLTEWADRQGVALSDVAYLGNDVNDVSCLRAVGWPLVVADAHPDARRASPIVLRRRGGDGAVRELADRVLAGHEARPTVSHSTTTEGHDHD